MLGPDRLKKISDYIRERRTVTIQELTDYFQVSDMTIRRDLQKLGEGEGEFRRIHGGVVWAEADVPIIQREGEHAAEKKRIAQRCLDFIEPGDMVVLDSGTTTFEIARALANSSLRDITVITNALNIAYYLRNTKGITLLIPGGELRQGTLSLVGATTRTFFDTIYADKVFLAACGVHMEAGFTNANFTEVEIKQCMSKVGRVSFYVMDSSKFDQRSLYMFAPLQDADMIITDNGIDEEWVQRLDQLGIPLERV